MSWGWRFELVKAIKIEYHMLCQHHRDYLQVCKFSAEILMKMLEFNSFKSVIGMFVKGGDE